ncbi:DUF4287 domain-containing protein [Sphingobacterium sp. E70]|uniref:DUF4287 domain-containing protein n=1 Tax=Sphingobacterium sp. E70 TaxID=2853439 RepID=UPI00359C8680
MKKGIKATQIVNWLKEDFELGHGHATAMYAYISGKGVNINCVIVFPLNQRPFNTVIG